MEAKVKEKLEETMRHYSLLLGTAKYKEARWLSLCICDLSLAVSNLRESKEEDGGGEEWKKDGE